MYVQIASLLQFSYDGYFESNDLYYLPASNVKLYDSFPCIFIAGERGCILGKKYMNNICYICFTCTF